MWQEPSFTLVIELNKSGSHSCHILCHPRLLFDLRFGSYCATVSVPRGKKSKSFN